MSGQNNSESTPEFEEFVASGEVEMGESNLTSPEEEKDSQPKTPAARRNPPRAKEVKEEPKAGEGEGEGDDTGEEGDGEEGDGEGEENSRSPKESHIDRLKRERAAAQREARDLRRRLDAVENGDLARRLENLEKGLQGGNSGGNSDPGKPEPDPTDTEKYPLGHLDDRYIEDKLEWLTDKKAVERADAVLQRQQENERNQATEQVQQVLLEKVDDLSARGSDLYEDFQENVVEAGMKGEWELSQATFEAAHEADNGAQILYELAQDKKEASRVAKLSPFQQLKFVQERDAEIGKTKTPRKIPQAGEPAKHTARGANSRTQINPATENLDDFEKAWEADAKKGLR